jgi:galactose mutarotase-like enzyme
LQYSLETDFLKITADSHGAGLTGIIDQADGYQYLWQGDPAFWPGRAPVLFPIIGNLNGGKYLYQGKEYAMGRHGFASNREFLCSESGGNSLTFFLNQDDATLSQYPFEFNLSVTYTLQERTVTTAFRVENPGNQTIWFSIGGHPGFNCGLNSDGKKSGRLVFEKTETARRIINESGFLTGREAACLNNEDTVDLADWDFDGKTKVAIFEKLRSDYVTLEDRGNGRKVRLRFAGLPYLGIWSPSNAAPFVCLEPWYGVTDTIGVNTILDQKRGIQSLAAGAIFSCGYDIMI